MVHKANVIRKAYGLFLEACRDVAKQFPDVAVEDYHIDAMTAHLVRRGGDFDVILTTNMFGDILSDLTGELSGSLGMAPSINAGTGRAMAQASHGSAPDIAGKGIANPVGLILSSAMLLSWLARNARTSPRGKQDARSSGGCGHPKEGAEPATWAEPPIPASSPRASCGTSSRNIAGRRSCLPYREGGLTPHHTVVWFVRGTVRPRVGCV